MQPVDRTLEKETVRERRQPEGARGCRGLRGLRDRQDRKEGGKKEGRREGRKMGQQCATPNVTIPFKATYTHHHNQTFSLSISLFLPGKG